VLGVDGGNTKTVAVVAADDGIVIGRGSGGCSDIYGAASAEAAMSELDSAVHAALGAAGLVPGDLASAVFSLAGVDWPEDAQFVRGALDARGFLRGLAVYNDAFAPLRAGSDVFTGVSVVCGTGAAVGARSSSGETWQASWWLDVQGARQIGHRALWAVFHAELGIGAATSITEGILEAYGAETAVDLLHRLTRRVGGAWSPESAAPVLVREAERGDQVAVDIAESHGRALAEYALVAQRRVHMRSLDRLVLAGTVLRRSAVMARSVVARVREEQPQAEAVMPDLIPAGGAVLLAMDRAGIAASAGVRERLAQQLAD
jgi:N-acetylglucosamine kinase-like BadF-type ATPase